MSAIYIAQYTGIYIAPNPSSNSSTASSPIFKDRLYISSQEREAETSVFPRPVRLTGMNPFPLVFTVAWVSPAQREGGLQFLNHVGIRSPL